jgi:hypothetical protein
MEEKISSPPGPLSKTEERGFGEGEDHEEVLHSHPLSKIASFAISERGPGGEDIFPRSLVSSLFFATIRASCFCFSYWGADADNDDYHSRD